MKMEFTRIWSIGCALLVVAFLVAMCILFGWQSLPLWQHEGLSYLTGKEWFYRSGIFGILPMLYGSVVVSIIALAFAGPIGVGAALFNAEYAPARIRLLLKMLIELLAGVPSVIYGMLGILFLRNWIYDFLEPFDPLSGDTLLTGGILLAVMILPTVMTLSDDALRGVPAAQRAAARGLGLTQAESILSVSLPKARMGILAALLLALGRALGETIAVFLVVGRQDNQCPQNLISPRAWIESGQTLTSKLAGSETNIAYGQPLHWAAIVGLGLVLMALVAGVTIAGAHFGRGKEADA